jgi:hypothetical protein
LSNDFIALVDDIEDLFCHLALQRLFEGFPLC